MKMLAQVSFQSRSISYTSTQHVKVTF